MPCCVQETFLRRSCRTAGTVLYEKKQPRNDHRDSVGPHQAAKGPAITHAKRQQNGHCNQGEIGPDRPYPKGHGAVNPYQRQLARRENRVVIEQPIDNDLRDRQRGHNRKLSKETNRLRPARSLAIDHVGRSVRHLLFRRLRTAFQNQRGLRGRIADMNRGLAGKQIVEQPPHELGPPTAGQLGPPPRRSRPPACGRRQPPGDPIANVIGAAHKVRGQMGLATDASQGGEEKLAKHGKLRRRLARRPRRALLKRQGQAPLDAGGKVVDSCARRSPRSMPRTARIRFTSAVCRLASSMIRSSRSTRRAGWSRCFASPSRHFHSSCTTARLR